MNPKIQAADALAQAVRAYIDAGRSSLPGLEKRPQKAQCFTQMAKALTEYELWCVFSPKREREKKEAADAAQPENPVAADALAKKAPCKSDETTAQIIA